MGLKRLTLTIPAAEATTVEALLTLAGAVSVSYEDAASTVLLEPTPGTEPLWPVVALRALFEDDVDTARINRLLAPTCRDAEPAWDSLADQDWRAALEQRAEPLEIGRRLLIVPADWSGQTTRTVVRLNIGFAFGTGQHPTTALCLEWLERHTLERATVLDFGCGSGVLAVAALRLGAAEAWGTDTEPQALTATRRNAERNGVGSALRLGPPDAIPIVGCDVVLANIIAGTLIRSSTWIAERVAPNGWLVLSGLLEHQRDAVQAAFADRFVDFEYAARGGWLRLTARASY